MKERFRDAFEVTDGELCTLAGLAIALSDLLVHHNDSCNPEDRSIVAISLALREKAEAVLDLHQAEWEFQNINSD